MSVCYFAPNLNFITFFFAVVHGGAVAGIFVAVNVVSCQYFDKWQTTACGISWASQCLNVFFMPQVANYFLLEYGMPGMFLLLGALTLNGFPPTILLHSPPWLKVHRAQGEARPSKVLLAMNETGPNLADNSADHLDIETSQSEGEAFVNGIRKDASKQTEQDPSKVLSVKPTSDLKQTLKAFLTPTFLIDTLSFAVQIYSMTTFYLVHIDLALDYGIESDHSIYFMHIYSVGDYLMRVLSGVIVDRGCMSLTTVMVLGFVGNAAGFEALALSRSFIPFVFVTLFLGVSGGIMAALPAPVLISDFRGRSLSILLGGMLFLEGLVIMTRPSLIGFFRDNIGSYDGLVHTIAAVNGLLSIVWILKRHFQGRKAPKITGGNIPSAPI
ncbi:monocarboxylate transporter 12-B-like [Ixodes scapularis]